MSSMLRSQLVARLTELKPELRPDEVENAVNIILDSISTALEDGGRVEIRGFGTFSVRQRKSRESRNPRTGEKVQVPAKSVPFFKPGNELRAQVNGGRDPESQS